MESLSLCLCVYDLQNVILWYFYNVKNNRHDKRKQTHITKEAAPSNQMVAQGQWKNVQNEILRNTESATKHCECLNAWLETGSHAS